MISPGPEFDRLIDRRRIFSSGKLEELSRRFSKSPALTAYANLLIYAAGSYARGEASQYSDIDLFFIHNDHGGEIDEPRLKGIRVLSAVIREIEDGMDFPPPSNDGQFLNIIPLSEILKHLGGAEDDYKNHFTARMLLLLESAPVYGNMDYGECLDQLVESYMRDYEDHARDFRATFLANDILRFWKTLCLNYEHKRNQVEEIKKVKQKIKNFKLEHSRLMTCFATIAALSTYNSINKAEILEICKKQPIARLQFAASRCPAAAASVTDALKAYAWFLEKTELAAPELEKYFADKKNRVIAFENADNFGRCMYEVVKLAAEGTGTMRYLVI